MTAAPKWFEGHQIGFDNESTGVDVHTDRIVTASIVHLDPTHRPRTLSWLINPGIPVPDEAAAVHGWTTDRIESTLAGAEALGTVNGRTRRIPKARAIEEIAGQVAAAFHTKTPLVAFNASFDLSLLDAECSRHQVATLAQRVGSKAVRGVVDPFVLDKHYSRRRNKCTCGCGATSRQLSEQVKHYRVILAGAHDAGADALAAARLIPRMVAAYPELKRLSLSKLHDLQVEWRAEQCDSLRSYFDKLGKEHDGVCPEWPLHTKCAPTAAETAVA